MGKNLHVYKNIIQTLLEDDCIFHKNAMIIRKYRHHGYRHSIFGCIFTCLRVGHILMKNVSVVTKLD